MGMSSKVTFLMGESSKVTFLMGESSKVTVKLTVNKASNRVLFAEAEKDFVDFLFYIHELPVGIVSRLVRSVLDDASGSMHNIENSIRNLPDRYMISNQKAALLDLQVLDNPHATCTDWGEKLKKKLASVVEPSDEAVVALHDGEGGYVKGLATYMVTDDLVVKPMMFNSCIDSLREFKVERLEDIEEKVVDVSLVECMKLLDASLRSKTVLTDTFLPKKPPKRLALQRASKLGYKFQSMN